MTPGDLVMLRPSLVRLPRASHFWPACVIEAGALWMAQDDDCAAGFLATYVCSVTGPRCDVYIFMCELGLVFRPVHYGVCVVAAAIDACVEDH